MSPLVKAGFIQGWMWATNAPKEMQDAIAELIDALTRRYDIPEEIAAIQAVMNEQYDMIGELNEKLTKQNGANAPSTNVLSDKPASEQNTAVQPLKEPYRSPGAKRKLDDSHFASIKTDFDAGMTIASIGRRNNCSDTTICNFLRKHGINPIRNKSQSEVMKSSDRPNGRPVLTAEQKQLILDEKAKGTPSKEIGAMIDRSQHAVDVLYSRMKKQAEPSPGEARAPFVTTGGAE